MKIFKSVSLLLIFTVVALLIVFQSHASGSAIDPSKEEQIQQDVLSFEKEAILLEDVVFGTLSARTFNASWISDTELLFRDTNGHLVLLNVSAPTPELNTLVANTTLVSILISAALCSNITGSFVITVARILHAKVLTVSRPTVSPFGLQRKKGNCYSLHTWMHA